MLRGSANKATTTLWPCRRN